MSDVNLRPQSYRQRQALQTRKLIVQAARKLFAGGGYGTTSIDAVAEEAGVSPRTIYAAFGSKKGILGAICEAWLEESGIQEAVSKGLAEPDLGRRLALVAESSRRQWESERGVVALLEGAATSDAEVARMVAGWKDDRARSFRMVVEGLEKQLRPGLDANEAGAMIRALTGSEVYTELVVREGWSGENYERWLNGLLVQLLVPGRRRIKHS
ncbi:MAG: TetR/AcrR family transcriptional regulator [Candidatus Dormibacteraceae bacterium]